MAKVSKAREEIIVGELLRMRREAREQSAKPLDEGIEVIKAYDDGWAWGKVTGYEYALRDALGKEEFYRLANVAADQDQFGRSGPR